MVETIKYKDTILAILIPADFKNEKISFFTPDDFSQQLAYMNRPKGYVIPPHIHNQIAREVTLTKEVLIIRSGKVRIDLYTDAKEYLESRILQEGDVILLAHGGHGLRMLETSEIIEVKQGPYLNDRDKVRFEPIDDNKAVIKQRTL